MQLEDANRDAEDLRRYNASMRREHAATLADLEEELEGERSSKTDPLGQIVELQYRIATLEGDLEEARAGRGRDRKNILAEMEGEVVNRVEGELRSLKDQLRQKLSEAEKSRRMLDEMKDGMKDRERALRDKLRARSDEAEATKRSLDKAREEASARETSLKTQLRARDAELETMLLRWRQSWRRSVRRLEGSNLCRSRLLFPTHGLISRRAAEGRRSSSCNPSSKTTRDTSWSIYAKLI